MGKIIGILNQKGGVGKSTTACHLAMTIYHNYNYEKRSNFAAVFDADFPQLTINNYRLEEIQYLKSVESEGNQFYENKLNKIYLNDFKPMSIYTGSLQEFKEKSNLLRKTFDFTFVDVVGTVNTEGFDMSFLSQLDYIIIPTTTNFESLRSTIEFVRNIIVPATENTNLKYSILFNNIPNTQINEYNAIKENLLNNNYALFDNFISQREKYVRLYLHYKGKDGLLSTLFPSFDVSLNNVANEFLTKIK